MTRTTNHINHGVIARYIGTTGFKLAVCVGFGRDYRPRIRLYSATSKRWSQPKLVDRESLVGLDDLERQSNVLRVSLVMLDGVRQQDVALLSAAPPAPTTGNANSRGDTCACGHAVEEHGNNPHYPGSSECSECPDGACIAYEAER